MSERYRLNLTTDQRVHLFFKKLPWGLQSQIANAVMHDIIDLVEEHGLDAVVAALTIRNVRATTKMQKEIEENLARIKELEG